MDDHLKKILDDLKKVKNDQWAIEIKLSAGKKLYEEQDRTKQQIVEFEKNNSGLEKELAMVTENIKSLENEIETINKNIAKDVITRLGVVNNENYLTRCIIYLRNIRMNYALTTYIVTDPNEMVEIGEDEIIENAHIVHNEMLVIKTAPHEFFHNHECCEEHKIKKIPCSWDGMDDRCDCGCKCPEWDTEGVNWLTDINLDSTKPMGYMKCSWHDF